ncbi:DUF1501 domain-containing protein [Undibacterium sp. Rencai35W]|uniref:DUF1501 domain-containing protein n=1 Tax=Undibacterium sp. Rencai35W TaxID=3413046 RepID=UPI003BF162C7
MQRRDFLRHVAATGLGAALGPWAQMQALAQTTTGSDYRAMVCLFMFGGNDGNNLIVPTDTTPYSQYQKIRPNLALDRNALLPVKPSNTGGATYGLHPAMSGIQKLFNDGHAAVVANVGPLIVPTSKAQWDARSVPLPSNLFSHSDQQLAWQSALVDAPGRSGWGGRLLERTVAESSANRGYSAISVTGSNLWETSDKNLSPYRVSSSGNFGFDFYNPNGGDPLSAAISEVLAEKRSDPFEQTWLNLMGRSIDNQRILTGALSSSQVATVFPDTDLGRQLRMIARLISARGSLGLTRQCFFCSIGGFDTHGDDQLQRQNDNFNEISAAVAAFYAATAELGLAKNVTLFTASDFGRTLTSNGGGSDHGWGNHHVVVGGAVKGGRLIGRFPEMTIGGRDDAGQGSWIPSTATDQVDGELARWFGADAATTDTILPRLQNFDRNLGLMEI